ncbi:amidohydrolase family protein [Novosphingobium sp. KACC 22771]|uniref:amidohydrolase family protein n=1 Tax=Novosphingobium sp. KACC 22771 TaxID=3025670 RepID=UPI002366B84F|nr:amidohydrolase family protein [Novosphingobium sp. KACC 22771]WDF74523.1 amidohydrolase family protein [Novosphingobium sp. KACC 22771]
MNTQLPPLRTGGAQGYLRIATEEAFAIPEMVEIYRGMLAEPDVDPGVQSLLGFYFTHESERARWVRERLLDLGEQRIADMDERGIDIQVLGLTSPGVQMLAADRATALAELANDRLAQACARYPDRFVGLASCALQEPDKAARELERAVTRLGMKGVIVNSHTLGEYLSDPKFWPVLEAAEALDVPLYLHPQTPPKSMIGPMVEAGLDGAVFGFGVETGFHALRMITAGVFDRFPRLKLVLGHMGEALPFWLYRLDFMHGAQVRSGRYDVLKPLQRGPVSAYLRENVWITCSGMAWEPAIRFSQDVLGVDRVLYAMDYPYQCPADEVRALDAMGLADDDKKRFFQTNAENLFKIAGGAAA